MPGFQLGTLSTPDVASRMNPPSSVSPILTYTWHVANLFGDDIDDSKPTIFLKDCTPPDLTFEAEEVTIPSTVLKFAKKATWGDVKVVFYDTTGLLSIISAWRNKIWTDKDGIRPAAEYKNDSIIKILNLDNTVQGGWILHGSWPKIVSYSSLTYTSSDVHTVSVTIAYDWADQKTSAF